MTPTLLPRLLVASVLISASVAAQDASESEAAPDESLQTSPATQAIPDAGVDELDAGFVEGGMADAGSDAQVHGDAYVSKPPLAQSDVEAHLGPLLDKHAFCKRSPIRYSHIASRSANEGSAASLSKRERAARASSRPAAPHNPSPHPARLARSRVST